MQSRRQFCIAEHAAPFREGQVRGDDGAGAFVDFRQQMELQFLPRANTIGVGAKFVALYRFTQSTCAMC